MATDRRSGKYRPSSLVVGTYFFPWLAPPVLINCILLERKISSGSSCRGKKVIKFIIIFFFIHANSNSRSKD